MKNNCTLPSRPTWHKNDLNRLIKTLDTDLTKIVSFLGKRARMKELKSSCTISGRQQRTPKIGQ